MKILVVVDMQKDFVTGTLGSKMAEEIVTSVINKIDKYMYGENQIIFTLDTHYENYLSTLEGEKLPVKHCIKGTDGHELIDEIKKHLDIQNYKIIEKNTFGSFELADYIEKLDNVEEIEFIGLCTDICVVSNAMILRAKFPNTKITVDKNCCAGVTEESHNAAITTMKMCQIDIEGE